MTARTRRTPFALASAVGVPALLVIFAVVVILPAGYVLDCLSNLLDLVFGARP